MTQYNDDQQPISSTMPTTEEIYFPSDTSSTAPRVDPIIFDPYFSPSASSTSFSPPASYKATEKPTFLRSQQYCSRHHKRPRRCINRGCLFDSTTLQCTNGVPTPTPSAFPSESPSELLTKSPQPTNKTYRVRLYWEHGYKWQGDSIEKFFCWACAQCSECSEEIRDRTRDCVDLLCEARHHCAEGMSIAVTDCSPNQSNDMSAEFSFLPEHSGLFDTYLKGGQIQVHNTDLCLSLVGVRSIELQTCDAAKIEQRFQGFQPDEGVMELFPVGTNLKDGRGKEVWNSASLNITIRDWERESLQRNVRKQGDLTPAFGIFGQSSKPIFVDRMERNDCMIHWRFSHVLGD